MKTSVELMKKYKEETGNSYMQVQFAYNQIIDDSDNEWNMLTIQQCIEWIESKINTKP